MTGAQPIIRFRNVVKSFGTNRVLDDLDLDIARGEKVAIVGPSGSGKSTVLRILMTLERIDKGVVEVEGTSVFSMQRDGRTVPADERHLRAIRAKLGMVFQQFNLFPHLTVLGNITEAPRRVLGLSREEAEERAFELLATVGLTDKAREYPSRLSGGQQQRVAIARALAMRPRIMLFDEVTSALDPELVGEVLAVMHALARSSDLTMLIVTHQMGFARRVADRVCFFEGGRIVEQGPPIQLFENPRSERTRSFLAAVLNE